MTIPPSVLARADAVIESYQTNFVLMSAIATTWFCWHTLTGSGTAHVQLVSGNGDR